MDGPRVNRLPPVEHPRDGLVYIRIPDTPKSINKVGARGSWRAVHMQKKRWQTIMERHLMIAKIPRPLPRPLEVSASLKFPTLHRRDEGNYRAPLEKALGDALVNGGWMLDDTPEWWTFRRVYFDNERGPNTTLLILDWSDNGE